MVRIAKSGDLNFPPSGFGHVRRELFLGIMVEVGPVVLGQAFVGYIARVKTKSGTSVSVQVSINVHDGLKVASTRGGTIGSKHRNFTADVNATKFNNPP